MALRLAAAAAPLLSQEIEIEEMLEKLEKTKKHIDNEEFVELMEQMEKVGWGGEGWLGVGIKRLVYAHICMDVSTLCATTCTHLAQQ